MLRSHHWWCAVDTSFAGPPTRSSSYSILLVTLSTLKAGSITSLWYCCLPAAASTLLSTLANIVSSRTASDVWFQKSDRTNSSSPKFRLFPERNKKISAPNNKVRSYVQYMNVLRCLMPYCGKFSYVFLLAEYCNHVILISIWYISVCTVIYYCIFIFNSNELCSYLP